MPVAYISVKFVAFRCRIDIEICSKYSFNNILDFVTGIWELQEWILPVGFCGIGWVYLSEFCRLLCHERKSIFPYQEKVLVKQNIKFPRWL